VNVPFGGLALRSATRYRWKVRVWGRDGTASAWSSPAWWETGLLAASNWQAQWIGGPVAPPLDLAGSHWIWYPDGDPGTAAPAGSRFFRGSVTVPEGKSVRSARMLLSVDDSFVAYLNGAQVAASAGTWQQSVAVGLTGQLRPGPNVVAVAATNVGSSPAGVLAVIEVVCTDGTTVVVRSDQRGGRPRPRRAAGATSRSTIRPGSTPWPSHRTARACGPVAAVSRCRRRRVIRCCAGCFR
jgi:alpha-L-rhamnosidase